MILKKPDLLQDACISQLVTVAKMACTFEM